jgi:hypothetical protein
MTLLYLLVAGYPEDGAGVAQGDPSTGRHWINLLGVHIMDRFWWTALMWVLMAAMAATAG